MAMELVCSCGRLLRIDEPPADGQVSCPDCHAFVTIEPGQPPVATFDSPCTEPSTPVRKPLWAVMGHQQNQLATPQESDDSAATPESSEPAPAPPAATGPVAVRKSLWGLMQAPAVESLTNSKIDAGPAGSIHFESAPETSSPEIDEQSDSDPGAGADSKRTGPSSSPQQRAQSEVRNSKSQIAVASPPDSLAAMIGIAEDEALLSARSKFAGSYADNSRRAIAAAVMGGLSIPFSGLALINAGWSRLPATALGFVAILTGMIASQEIERSGGRKTGRRMAIAGIVTGILGSFLGPLVIAPLSRPRKGR